MKRRILTLLQLFAAAFMVLEASVGDWTHYPAFALPLGEVACGDGMVYYTAGGNLFSYDSEADESQTYSLVDKLNGTDISSIYYNPSGHYLAVSYKSGVIDLLYDRGERVVKVSDIAEADVNGSKAVNDIAFAKDRMYIATDFGLIEYNDARHEVVQSGIFEKPVEQVEMIYDNIVILYDNTVRTLPLGNRFNSIDRFYKTQDSWGVGQVTAINDSCLVIIRPNNPSVHIQVCTYSPDGKKVLRSIVVPGFTKGAKMLQTDGQAPYMMYEGRLHTVSADGTITPTGVRSEVLLSGNVALGKGPDEVWALSLDGLASYDLSGESTVATRQPMRPGDVNVANVANLRLSPDGKSIYAWNLGPSVYRSAASSGNRPLQAMAVGDNGRQFEDIAPYDFISNIPGIRAEQIKSGFDIIYEPTSLTPHPSDPSVIYFGTSRDGLIKVTDGKVDGVYDNTNSPLPLILASDKATPWATRVFASEIDPEGNLWVATFKVDEIDYALFMLPADKAQAPASEVRISDWKIIRAPGFCESNGGMDARIHISKRNNMIFVFMERLNLGVLAIDTKGTWGNTDDDRMLVHTSFIDQDGKSFSPARITSVCEDSRGRIWLGTSEGIIEISNPKNAVNPEMTVNRLKVPRNDGTNSADYLLDADLINSVSEDNSGRKWIATDVSGLYLVSANGQEIITHYSSDNSPLASNTINAVLADPSSNTVWVGTSEGLFSFESDSSPARDSYDDVLVYPNPVRPEHTGPVTITGLMDGTLLKIADAAGNVVAQLTSEGGMAQWNCENSAGRRVPTGIYYVMLSSGNGNDGTSSSGAVAKFMIVN